jgi:hypothetical protein
MYRTILKVMEMIISLVQFNCLLSNQNMLKFHFGIKNKHYEKIRLFREFGISNEFF